MVAIAVETLVRQAETLSIEDQLLLMARLAENMRQQWQPTATRRKWREIRGIVQSSYENKLAVLKIEPRRSGSGRSLTLGGSVFIVFGAAKACHLMGEDAQAWVSRTRHEQQ